MDENAAPAALPATHPESHPAPLPQSHPTALPAALFEEQRPHLRAVAYRLLGTFEEADEAVEDVRRTGRAREAPIAPGPVPATDDPTAAVARACLARLRSRETLREHPWDPWDPWASGGPHHTAPATPLGNPQEQPQPTTLDELTPPERLAYVLHDEFSVPYEEIALIVERTPAATRQLAGRARYRLQEAEEMPEPDLPRQREIVAAFRTAARNGDAAALHELLDPEVVLRADATAVRTGATVVHGPGAVAEAIADRVGTARRALVDGAAGLAWPPEGDPRLVFAFTVLEDRITAIDALSDADHLSSLKLQL
ncbi:RNA polymerase subunit sigma-70 [Streptomyces sp. NBC_00250]|uniref:sigma factor-like helix-turn-helix DNA-binding protein n=1 Tax=Streptomyces sp. NBC_00250 TaxID=2903641 RepID=UPI002E27F91C|nr:sigma factor-like helix-turn-helix DNA-binding protein [Streptomyces sp. NBC_00250]